jgi:hypothetical protein
MTAILGLDRKAAAHTRPRGFWHGTGDGAATRWPPRYH